MGMQRLHQFFGFAGSCARHGCVSALGQVEKSRCLDLACAIDFKPSDKNYNQAIISCVSKSNDLSDGFCLL